MTITPYHVDDLVTVYGGDCLDVLRTLPDNSVDAVVTDPPYGLEFMGREWDSPWKRGDGIVADAGFAQTGYSDDSHRLPRPTFTGSTNPRCFACSGTRRGRRDGTALTKVCRCEDGGQFPNVRAEEMPRSPSGAASGPPSACAFSSPAGTCSPSAAPAPGTG
jgi:hypothetical protein